ncbi:MAG: threonine--tRNA ligase [bacterium]
MKNENNNLEIIRHSLSHVLMQALTRLYGAIPGVGPAIENGFYHDVDLSADNTPLAPLKRGEAQISVDDLPKIEKEMKKIINEGLEIKKKIMPIGEGIKFLREKGYIYTAELAEELKAHGETGISFYEQGEFINMCKGQHLNATDEINPDGFKLTKIAGAYWKGTEKNKMLQRIYGVAFATKEELENYLKMIEEAEKRDHRKLGKELDLFSFHPESPGCPFWHEKGMYLWRQMQKFGQELRKKYGYIEIKTPQIAKNNLWITSGHWDHYKESMFTLDVEGEIYCLKPMDCPFNIKIYQTQTRSYRDLPIRYTEIGRIYRNEKSGELNGLFRVREITQDDSHIFLCEDYVEEEIINLIDMVKEYYAALTVDPEFFFSSRPDDFMGEIYAWDKAEESLKNALKKKNIKYGLKEKDGAFYGPKIDVNIKDVFGRSWQVATIQLDFQLPGRFECEYINKDGAKKTPVMIHAAIFGSFERMIGVLIEHFGGAFPLWLSPAQVKIISVGEGHIEFCKKLADEFRAENIRVELDANDETVGNKIRKARMEKVPYVLVIGDKEIGSDKLHINVRGQKEIIEMGKSEFMERVKEEIREKK